MSFPLLKVHGFVRIKLLIRLEGWIQFPVSVRGPHLSISLPIKFLQKSKSQIVSSIPYGPSMRQNGGYSLILSQIHEHGRNICISPLHDKAGIVILGGLYRMNSQFGLMIKKLFVSTIYVCVLLVPVLSPAKQGETGFLGDYSRLFPIKNLPGVRFEGAVHDGFLERRKLLLSDVTVRMHPDVEAGLVKSDQLRSLAKDFKADLRQVLTKNYHIVDIPGDDIVVMRVALTDVVPDDLYLNVAWNNERPGFAINHATIEIDFNIASTGQRVFALFDERLSAHFDFEQRRPSWFHTDDLVYEIEDLLAEIVESANGD